MHNTSQQHSTEAHERITVEKQVTECGQSEQLRKKHGDTSEIKHERLEEQIHT
jgi:hypothetical protein